MTLSYYLSPYAVASLIGISHTSLYYYIKEPEKHSQTEEKIEDFLDTDGKKLNEIQLAFKSGSKNRSELHRQRNNFIKKAKAHPTYQSCEAPL